MLIFFEYSKVLIFKNSLLLKFTARMYYKRSVVIPFLGISVKLPNRQHRVY